MKNIKYKIGVQEFLGGRVLIMKDSSWSDDYLEIFDKEECSFLRIPYLNRWGSDVEFLKHFTWRPLRGLEVYSMDVKDFSALQHLKSIELIGLTSKPKFFPSLVQFKNLKILMFDHCSALTSAYSCTAPNKLTITGYPFTNLSQLSSYRNLESLTLHKGKLQSLRGIENLSRLSLLDISYSRKLVDIDCLLKRGPIDILRIHRSGLSLTEDYTKYAKKVLVS